MSLTRTDLLTQGHGPNELDVMFSVFDRKRGEKPRRSLFTTSCIVGQESRWKGKAIGEFIAEIDGATALSLGTYEISGTAVIYGESVCFKAIYDCHSRHGQFQFGEDNPDDTISADKLQAEKAVWLFKIARQMAAASQISDAQARRIVVRDWERFAKWVWDPDTDAETLAKIGKKIEEKEQPLMW